MHLALPLWIALATVAPPAPPPVLAADLALFPGPEAAEAALESAYSRVAHLEGLTVTQQWGMRGDHDTALQDARWCHACWQSLYWAHHGSDFEYGGYCESYQRQMLRELRDLLGPKAYYSGLMP